MCLIFHPVNSKAKIPITWLTNSAERNKDGCGIMYPKGGRLIIKKTLDKYHDLETEAMANGVYAIHHRFKTDGTISADNCHPFILLSKDEGDKIDLALMHNGIISITAATAKDTRSDTALFCDCVLKPLLKLDNNLWKSDAFRLLCELSIGSSKLLLMSSNGDTVIINKEKGEVKQNIWLSTPGYIEKTYIYNPSNPYTGYYGGGGYLQNLKNDKEEQDDYYNTFLGQSDKAETPKGTENTTDTRLINNIRNYRAEVYALIRTVKGARLVDNIAVAVRKFNYTDLQTALNYLKEFVLQEIWDNAAIENTHLAEVAADEELQNIENAAFWCLSTPEKMTFSEIKKILLGNPPLEAVGKPQQKKQEEREETKK